MSDANARCSTRFSSKSIIHRNCPSCDRDNRTEAKLGYSHPNWPLKRCADCGFVYLEQGVEHVLLEEELAWEKTFKNQQRERLRRWPWIKPTARYLKRIFVPPRRDTSDYVKAYIKQGNLLDVGCSEGNQLVGLTDSYTPYGIEIAKRAAEKANRKFAPFGGRVVQAPALAGLEAFDAEFFEGALLRSYLEHETAPRQVLAELRRVLKRGGRALVKVPNFDCLPRRVVGSRWCGFRHPDHVNYFTRSSLRQMAESEGYDTYFIPMKCLPIGDNMTAVLTRV